MSELPIAAVDRIIRKGSGLRVSDAAAAELANILDEKGTEISQKAATFAKHANRKTITAEDIRLAVKNV